MEMKVMAGSAIWVILALMIFLLASVVSAAQNSATLIGQIDSINLEQHVLTLNPSDGNRYQIDLSRVEVLTASGKHGSVSDLTQGMLIRVYGVIHPKESTMQATRIRVLEQASRKPISVRVVMVNTPNSGVLTFRRGLRVYQVTVRSDLKVDWGTQNLSVSSLKCGDLLQIQGWREADGHVSIEKMVLLQQSSSEDSRWVGTVLSSNHDSMSLKLQTGIGSQWVDASKCRFFRNGEACDFLDLRDGDVIRVEGAAGSSGLIAKRIDLFPREPASHQQLEGRVLSIDYNTRQFAMQIGDQRLDVCSGSNTVVLRKGVAIAFEDLDEGDQVKVLGASPVPNLIVARFVQMG